MTVAKMFELSGRKIHPIVEAAISPGSKQVLHMITSEGAYGVLLEAGFRFLENACGPCIGMGFAPPSGGVSVRTFNRTSMDVQVPKRQEFTLLHQKLLQPVL